MARQFRLENLLASPMAATVAVVPNRAGDAHSARATLVVEGLLRARCARRMESALRAPPGVVAARCSLAEQRASIHYDPERCTLAQLEETVRGAVIAMPLRRALAMGGGCAKRWDHHGEA